MTQDGAGELLLSHAAGSAAGPPGHLVPALVPIPPHLDRPSLPMHLQMGGAFYQDSFGPPCSLSPALHPLLRQLLPLDTRLLLACFFALLSSSLLKSDCLPGPYPLAYFCLLSDTEFCWFFQCDQPRSSHHPPPPSALSPHQLSPRSCRELPHGPPRSRLFSRFKVQGYT